MRFPMTLGRFSKVITVLTLLMLGVLVPVQLSVLLHLGPIPAAKPLLLAGLVVLALTLLFLVAAAPRAVRVTDHKLTVERLFWPDFELPLREVVALEEGPVMSVFGNVWRVAGNGGVMGFTGLFHVKWVGLVRCWATRLELPTVVVRRAHARPLLLGVDDPSALLRTLRRVTGR